MGEGRQPGKPGCLRMPAQFIRRFDCNTLPVALQFLRQRMVKQCRLNRSTQH